MGGFYIHGFYCIKWWDQEYKPSAIVLTKILTQGSAQEGFMCMYMASNIITVHTLYT